MKNEILKNEIFEAKIEGFTSEAHGLCHLRGMAVFVPYALPEEVVRVRIVKVLSSYSFGKIEEILVPSPQRTSPLCPHYRKCGGCTTQHMSYEEEKILKEGIVNDSLSRIAHLDLEVSSFYPSEQRVRYRNKASFSFSQKDGVIVSGFYRDRTHDVIPVSDCCIQSEISCRIASLLTDILNRFGFSAYDEFSGKGYIRHLFIRAGHVTGEIILCITSARGFGDKTGLIVSEMLAEFPDISGILLNIDKDPGNKLLKGAFYTLYGEETITDELCGLKFCISPLSFYQVNSLQAEKLYQKVREYAVIDPRDNILDLYCGIGTISLYLAGYAARVIGVEIVEAAVENANHNKTINGITNADFYCSDASRFRQYTDRLNFRPDCIVVDPPRKGLDRKTITDICSYSPERIVYVSCNPATLSRDLVLFQELGYQGKKAEAFDMFPFTNHVETVVLLWRKAEQADRHIVVNYETQGRHMKKNK